MKNIKETIPFWITVIAILLVPSYLLCQPPFPGSPGGYGPPGASFRQSPPTLPIEKVSPGVFRLGEIRIQKESRSISFPAHVNMDKGLLEYLLVRSSGKVHESLLRTDVDPYHLQIALLLLGFEGTDRPLSEQGSSERPKGDPVEILVELRQKERSLSFKTEDWIARKTEKGFIGAGVIDWVYTGSAVVQGQFLAHSTGSIVAIYHDPSALVDNASQGGESDEIWFVKEGSVPPVGTPVIVTLKAKN